MIWVRKVGYILRAAGIAMFLFSCQPSDPDHPLGESRLPILQTLQFELGGVPVEIEIAITPREQMQGLMYRESMPENHGMLFVYNEPQYMGFWMKNTHIPLSIAFIRPDGTISNIEDMEPHAGLFDPTERYTSKYKCLYALEMNQGWFDQHGIREGDTILLPVDEIDILKKEK
jgi:uncharacterized protein